MILNFWIHFENLPVNSIVLKLQNCFSTQLADKKTQSFMNLPIRLPNSQLTANFLGQFLKTKLELKQQKLTELLKGHNNYMKTAD